MMSNLKIRTQCTCQAGTQVQGEQSSSTDTVNITSILYHLSRVYIVPNRTGRGAV